jgi:hypothetical protein
MPPTDAPTGTAPATDVLVRTRRGLHAVAEQVLAGALHRATGRIGLRRTAGGFGTPHFAGPAGVRQILVDGADLVVLTDDGDRRAPLTTVAAAAALVGVDPGGPVGVYAPATPLDPDADLAIDAAAARALADVLAVGDAALARLRSAHAADDPPEVQLWPEHFDLAGTVGRVNVGVSPGDADHPVPYLYVGPWDPEARRGPGWNESFGRSRPALPLPSAAEALDWFEAGLAAAAGPPTD